MSTRSCSLSRIYSHFNNNLVLFNFVEKDFSRDIPYPVPSQYQRKCFTVLLIRVVKVVNTRTYKNVFLVEYLHITLLKNKRFDPFKLCAS